MWIWHILILEVDEAAQVPVAPMTPNLQLRRKSGVGRLEPPPSPTHQMHRKPQGRELDSSVEEMLRVEWNNVSDQAERIVLSPTVKRRSMSTGHLDCVGSDKKASRRLHQRNTARRKSRSLDSSPLPYDRPRPSIRRSYFIFTLFFL